MPPQGIQKHPRPAIFQFIIRRSRMQHDYRQAETRRRGEFGEPFRSLAGQIDRGRANDMNAARVFAKLAEPAG
jgi:hypothetical protein